MSDFDVYSYGMISSSTLHLLDGNFPEADCYSEIKATFRMIGGEAANSSIVLSRLGASVKLDGNWLGNNENGLFTLNILKSFNIDTSSLTVKDNYRGVEEIVFADGKTRTNFGTYQKLLFTEKQWNTPLKRDIEASRLVCLDPFFGEESLLAAKYCKELSKPYITIDCSFDSMLSQSADVVIISGEFRDREYKGVPKEELFREYKGSANGLVIFTSGGSEILYGSRGKPTQSLKPYKIDAVDTAGAGDSFRSGVVYGMLQAWDTDKVIDFASALAACVCKSFPGVLNSPVYNEVIDFMKR